MEILVVDDEKEITSLFQDYLELNGGHKITIAYSGTEALEKVRKRKPDLIIMDHLMPGLTGVGVADLLKSREETANIPIVIFSISDAPSPDEKKDMGIVEFLAKPIDFTKLKQIIEELEKQKN